MKIINYKKARLALPIIILWLAGLACTHVFFIDNEADCNYSGGYWKGSTCYTAAEIDKVDLQTNEQDPESQQIPAGTYAGESTFYTTLENDVDNSYLAPVCTENIVQVMLSSDGTATGEVRSLCYANQDTDIEDMMMTHHSDVTGSIQGEWVDGAWQLSIDYSWRSYISSPQWDEPGMDNTVEFTFPYHATFNNGAMALTPAAEVEGYYSFTLYKK